MRIQEARARLLMGPVLALACACSGSTEVFDETGQALGGQKLGPCELSTPLGQGETVVEEAEVCGAGVCLGYQGQVQCSCRCSGPDPSAFYCSCMDGFVCQPDVIRESGVRAGDDVYAGAYCIPAEP